MVELFCCKGSIQFRCPFLLATRRRPHPGGRGGSLTLTICLYSSGFYLSHTFITVCTPQVNPAKLAGYCLCLGLETPNQVCVLRSAALDAFPTKQLLMLYQQLSNLWFHLSHHQPCQQFSPLPLRPPWPAPWQRRT